MCARTFLRDSLTHLRSSCVSQNPTKTSQANVDTLRFRSTLHFISFRVEPLKPIYRYQHTVHQNLDQTTRTFLSVVVQELHDGEIHLKASFLRSLLSTPMSQATQHKPLHHQSCLLAWLAHLQHISEALTDHNDLFIFSGRRLSIHQHLRMILLLRS